MERRVIGWFITLLLPSMILMLVVIATWVHVSSTDEVKSRKIADNPSSFVSTSLYDVIITNLRVASKGDTSGGGALHLLDDGRVLLADGGGKLYFLAINGQKIETTELQARVPINLDVYRREAEHTSKWFRVTDFFVTGQTNASFTVFASHHIWHSAKRCYTLRVSSAQVSRNKAAAQQVNWITVFDSNPCLAKTRIPNTSGGRMAKLGENTLLLTVGTHGQNIVAGAKKDDYSYGKILAITLPGGQVRTFSRGNRNPQGLYVDDSGIWETEHGPRGGDELNLIVEGEDYGFPRSTFGTKYKDKTWNLGDPGTHKTGNLPVYAWVPSVGVSSLIRVDSKAYPLWRGDLLIGSLFGLNNGKSLFRVRIREGRAILVERIRTKQPVRDLLQTQDGKIVLWNGRGLVQLMELGDHVFSTCLGCHAVRYRNHGIGPDLAEIVGAKVARHKSFVYSDSLKSIQGSWTRERLDAFLENPQTFAPGTSMEFDGIEDPEQRRTIIQYLEQVGAR